MIIKNANVFPNMYEFLSSVEDKIRYFENVGKLIFIALF